MKNNNTGVILYCHAELRQSILKKAFERAWEIVK